MIWHCISLYQPWANLVVTGIKQFETRSWATKYRGPLYIHASKRFPQQGKDLMKEPALGFGGPEPTGLAFGAIIGRVDLHQVISPRKAISEIQVSGRDIELLLGDYREGRHIWELRNCLKFGNIYCKGSLSIWKYEPRPEDLEIERIAENERT